jgi:aspartokinase
VSVKGWEVVFTGERLQADLLAAVLEANEIRAEVFGDNAYAYGINFTEARVLVPDDQADRARKLIRAAQAELSPPP